MRENLLIIIASICFISCGKQLSHETAIEKIKSSSDTLLTYNLTFSRDVCSFTGGSTFVGGYMDGLSRLENEGYIKQKKSEPEWFYVNDKFNNFFINDGYSLLNEKKGRILLGHLYEVEISGIKIINETKCEVEATLSYDLNIIGGTFFSNQTTTETKTYDFSLYDDGWRLNEVKNPAH